MMGINVALRQWFTNFLDKKSAGTSTYTETWINFENQQLAEELPKPTIKKFKRRNNKKSW